MKDWMNKAFIGGVTLFFLQQGFAETVDCRQYTTTFKNMAYYSFALAKTGTFEQSLKYTDETSYSQLFQHKHAGQRYYASVWRDENEAIKMQKEIFEFQKIGLIKDFKVKKLQAAKASYKSTEGDVCLVPFQTEFTIFGRYTQAEYDIFFVRPEKSSQWRVFIYTGIENKQDMAEFFPDLPSQVQLSAARYNGLNYAESGEENVRQYFKYHNMTITSAQEAELLKLKKQNMQKLKENGYVD